MSAIAVLLDHDLELHRRLQQHGYRRVPVFLGGPDDGRSGGGRDGGRRVATATTIPV